MSTNEQQAKWADKIAALLRKAESTTPEEAELLMEKAQELMTKYAIDEAMLRAAGEDKGNDQIVAEEFVVIGIYRFPLSRLCKYILHYNGCEQVEYEFEYKPDGWRVIDGKMYKETVVIEAVGYKSDVDRARLLFSSLQLQAVRAENAWWEENKEMYAHEKKSVQHRARRGFLFGFADGAAIKLRDATARGRKAAAEEHGATGVALVLRDKSLAVKDEYNRLHSDARSTKSRMSRGDQFAQGSGILAGREADVGQAGVGGKRKEIDR